MNPFAVARAGGASAYNDPRADDVDEQQRTGRCHPDVRVPDHPVRRHRHGAVLLLFSQARTRGSRPVASPWPVRLPGRPSPGRHTPSGRGRFPDRLGRRVRRSRRPSPRAPSGIRWPMPPIRPRTAAVMYRAKRTIRGKARRAASDTSHGRAARARNRAGVRAARRRRSARADGQVAARADQAADHRRVAGHDRADDAAGPARAARGRIDLGHPGRRHAGRWQRQHDQLLHRPRHRRLDAAHVAPAARGQGRRRRPSSRPRPWCSGSCSAPLPRCCSAPW